ncbi:hypothetical protein IPN35_01340 [Candidatus Peregrinibacteria bacterium]|nr:MAG: hypothetical protein IPN35_01340 [Candidatus Peregrinibacteria bacterium]
MKNAKAFPEKVIQFALSFQDEKDENVHDIIIVTSEKNGQRIREIRGLLLPLENTIPLLINGKILDIPADSFQEIH